MKMQHLYNFCSKMRFTRSASWQVPVCHSIKHTDSQNAFAGRAQEKSPWCRDRVVPKQKSLLTEITFGREGGRKGEE